MINGVFCRRYAATVHKCLSSITANIYGPFTRWTSMSQFLLHSYHCYEYVHPHRTGGNCAFLSIHSSPRLHRTFSCLISSVTVSHLINQHHVCICWRRVNVKSDCTVTALEWPWPLDCNWHHSVLTSLVYPCSMRMTRLLFSGEIRQLTNWWSLVIHLNMAVQTFTIQSDTGIKPLSIPYAQIISIYLT